MKRIQLPFVILGILSAVIFLGCGDDDDDDNNNNNDNGGDASNVVGTWKMISIDGEPPPDVGTITMTIESNGTWRSSTILSDVPGIGQVTMTSKGTYKVSGNKISGKTTETQIEPDLGFADSTADTGFSEDETTFERNGNQLTLTDTDENGETTVTVYEKQ